MKGPTVLSTKIGLDDNFSNTAKKITRAVGDMQKGLDGLAGKLHEQVNSARMSAKEYDLYKASLMGASQAEKAKIASMHDLVATQKQEIAAAAEAERQKREEEAVSLRHQQTIKQAISALERQRDALKYTARELDLRTAAMNGATEAEIRHINNLHDGIDAMAKNDKTGRNLNGTLRLMRGGFGQVGHQIQDIAVQLQMGTNAMLVFGQQGGQIASLFGPKGAMIGAVLSVGAAIGTYLAPKLFEGEKAAEDFRKKVEELAAETKNLTEAQLAYLSVAYAEKLEEQKKQQADLQDEYSDEIRLLKQLERQLAITAASSPKFRQLQERIQAIQNGSARASAEVEVLASELKDTSSTLDALRNGKNPFRNAQDGASSLADRLDDVKDKILEYRQSQISETQKVQNAWLSQALAIRASEASKAVSSQEASDMMLAIAKIRASELEKIERDSAIERMEQEMEASKLALDAEKDALKERAKEYKDFADERLRLIESASGLQESLMTEMELIRKNEEDKLSLLREMEDAGLQMELSYAEMRKRLAKETADAIIAEKLRSSDTSEIEKATIQGEKQRAEFEKKTARDKTSFVLGELDGQLEGISKYNKKAFAIQKAVQIAQAIMNTHTAATKALAAYPPPLNAVFAALAVANGMAQVAQIKAQSFEGGGFTGTGSRSGGLDGKGGFMAMVHPNETIIDHTKPGNKMGGTTINIVNNVDASGGGAEVDQKIMAAMEVTSQQTVMQVQDLLRRQRLV